MSEGNYLRKARKNYFISAMAVKMLEDLSMDKGVNHSGIIELAVRDMYEKRFGDGCRPELPHKVSIPKQT